ncbi:hypothetical protein TMatcc_006887 [Talaromyces marneffei ATCC 18224]
MSCKEYIFGPRKHTFLINARNKIGNARILAGNCRPPPPTLPPASSLRLTSRFQSVRQHAFDSFVAKVSSDGLLVSRGIQISQCLGCRKRQSQDSDSSFTIASGVEHSSLHADNRLSDRLIDSNLNNVGLIARECWECAEIRAAVEKVAVERAHAKTRGSTHTQHSFQSDLRREVIRELPGEFDSIFCAGCIPSWVEVGLASGVARKIAKGSNILVL